MRQFKISDKLTPRKTKSAVSYLKELERTKPVSSEKEVELVKLAANGDENARNELVTANLRFVVSVAKMYNTNPDDFADIVAAGNIGLIEAVEKFDTTRGFKFISFAVWYIRKEMINYLNDNSRMIRVPTNKVDIIREITKIRNEISMREGREATFDESFEFMLQGNEKHSGAQRESLIMSMEADKKVVSISSPITADSDSGDLIDIMDSKSCHTDDVLIDGDVKKIIMILSKALNNLEKDIVFKKHGIAQDNQDSFEKSFNEIAIHLEVTPEAIRQKYTKSLKKMCLYGKKIGIHIYDVL
jgi:RNA polymerase primary sigma factor